MLEPWSDCQVRQGSMVAPAGRQVSEERLGLRPERGRRQRRPRRGVRPRRLQQAARTRAVRGRTLQASAEEGVDDRAVLRESGQVRTFAFNQVQSAHSFLSMIARKRKLKILLTRFLEVLSHSKAFLLETFYCVTNDSRRVNRVRTVKC